MKRLVTEGATSADLPVGVSARDRVRERRNARKRRKTLRTVLVALAVCVSVVGIYSAGFAYFSTHYYPGTQVVGIDAAGMTQDELSQAIDQRISSYEGHVANDTFNLTFTAADVDLACDAQELAKNLMLFQDASSWPAGIVGANARTEQDAGVTFDEQKLRAIVNEAVGAHNEGARLPVAATLALNSQKDAFYVVDERPGTALEPAAVYATVEEAVTHGEQEVALPASDLVQPTYKAGDEATSVALEKANEALGLTFDLVRGDQVLAHLSPESFVGWLVVNDDLSLAADGPSAAAWAEEWLWQTADYADDQNAYAVDSAALGESLSVALRARTGVASTEAAAAATVELPYVTTPRYLPGGGALNPTPWNAEVGRYIDVDKKSQAACLYDATGRVLWESLVTTGNETAENGTPLGRFGIYDKEADTFLLGLDKNEDGEPDYKVHVDWWMPFNGGVGFHDASWRTVFGGEEYVENGSGGCVNLPTEAAAALFAITHENETVIVHE